MIFPLHAYSGDIPKALGALSKLRELCLNANQLTGEKVPNMRIFSAR